MFCATVCGHGAIWGKANELDRSETLAGPRAGAAAGRAHVAVGADADALRDLRAAGLARRPAGGPPRAFRALALGVRGAGVRPDHAAAGAGGAGAGADAVGPGDAPDR